MFFAIFPTVFGDSKQSFPLEKANGFCDINYVPHGL